MPLYAPALLHNPTSLPTTKSVEEENVATETVTVVVPTAETEADAYLPPVTMTVIRLLPQHPPLAHLRRESLV
jgi:hypothetical protein